MSDDRSRQSTSSGPGDFSYSVGQARAFLAAMEVANQADRIVYVSLSTVLEALDKAEAENEKLRVQLGIVREFTELSFEPSPTARGSTPRDTFLNVQAYLKSAVLDD